MSVITIPDELLERLQRLADDEGISADHYSARALDHVATHAEGAFAEMDEVDEVATKKPDLSNCPAYAAVLDDKNGVQVRVHVHVTRETPKEPEPTRRMVYQKAQV